MVRAFVFICCFVNVLISQPAFEVNDTVACGGVERWAEKVLADSAAKAINFTAISISLADFIAIPTLSPSTSMKRFIGVEDKTYKILASITVKKEETDDDIHLVFSDGSKTFIGEIPEPTCPDAASTMHVTEYQKAKEFVLKNIGTGNIFNINLPLVEVTGVAFIDPPHGQTGAAPNHLELHPILNIKFKSITNSEQETKNITITIAPNPFLEFTHLTLESDIDLSSEMLFVLRTIYGKTEFIYPIKADHAHLLALDITRRDLEAGMYLFEIISKGKLIYSGKLIAL